MHLDIVRQAEKRLTVQRFQSLDCFSYLHFIARLLDVVHPTHTLQGIALSYPLYATTILRKRATLLGYKLPSDMFAFDLRVASDLVEQMRVRLESLHKNYFEVTFPSNIHARMGLVSSKFALQSEHFKYPGQEQYSFGIDSDGTIHWKGQQRQFLNMSVPEEGDLSFEFVTLGILVDVYEGSITIIKDGDAEELPAFGDGSYWDDTDQEFQRDIIKTSQMVPMIAIQGASLCGLRELAH